MGTFRAITINVTELNEFVAKNLDGNGQSAHSAIYVNPNSGKISVKVKEINKSAPDKLGNTISLVISPQKVKDENNVYSFLESEKDQDLVNVGGVKEITYQDKPR